jgi:DNA primase
MVYNEKIINEICEKADIVEIISSYIKLSKKGKDYVGICPFHPDTNPSLSVNSQKRI